MGCIEDVAIQRIAFQNAPGGFIQSAGRARSSCARAVDYIECETCLEFAAHAHLALTQKNSNRTGQGFGQGRARQASQP